MLNVFSSVFPFLPAECNMAAKNRLHLGSSQRPWLEEKKEKKKEKEEKTMDTATHSSRKCVKDCKIEEGDLIE